MRKTTVLALLFILLLGAVLPVQLSAESGPAVTNRIHGAAEVGYFFESDLYRYLADINVWFDFGRYKDVVFFFNSGILTYISSTSEKGFQPERYRGTLEPGAYLPLGRNTYYFYIKHQSFHDIDTYDNLDESYEIYTLAYKYSGNPRFFISVGKFLNTKDNDYDWEFLGAIEVPKFGSVGKRPLYVAGTVRQVTESDNPTGRDGFTDFTAEYGIETSPGLRFFLGYREIHDINRFNGITDNQFLIGARYTW